MSHENGGILGSLKGLFVEQVGEQSTNATKAADQDAAQMPQSSATTISASPALAGADESMVTELTKTVMNVSTAYSAFQDGLAAMASVEGMDEATRYRAAHAMLKSTQGRDAPSILQGLEVHIQALEGESLRFHSDADSRAESTRNQAKENITAIEGRTSAAAERIAALQAEIANLQQQVDEGKTEIADVEAKCSADVAKIDGVSKRFDAAVSVVSSRLTADRQKLTTYLK